MFFRHYESPTKHNSNLCSSGAYTNILRSVSIGTFNEKWIFFKKNGEFIPNPAWEELMQV